MPKLLRDPAVTKTWFPFFSKLEVRVVLEVGCGSGSLLIKLAEKAADLRAIGIDQNPAMIDQAKRAASPAVAARISWYHGDLLPVIADLDASVRDGVDVIVALSVANEYFAKQDIAAFLGGLSAAFPRRLLILGDYYGCLGGSPKERIGHSSSASEVRRAILHDVAQVVSGQGVPPRSLEEWKTHYAQAGCTLIDEAEATSAGVRRFRHLVQL